MSRRRPLTKLMLLGVAVVVCAACFVFGEFSHFTRLFASLSCVCVGGWVGGCV